MNKNDFAITPPMGWNSYDYYDTAVTEAEIRANASYMAENLKKYGWEYIVVDIQWYAHGAGSMREKYQYIPFSDLEMDEYGRLLPDPQRFPSSVNGAGFAPLADYVHSLGLKFGIHIMRGIPRIAAHNNSKIKGCVVTAREVADAYSICRWNPDMYGVCNTPEGQAYYDSLLELYASWGVDFIKCDDICNTDNWVAHSDRAFERRHEIEMLAKAIAKTNRSIVLSLSPGPALIDKAWHYETYANMWRITDDMWDTWDAVKNMFYRCELWQKHVSRGCYPDCDMLPLGMLGKGFGKERPTNLTREEQRTLMTLWCIFHSPLMMGGELTKLDDWTKSLLTNQRILGLLNMDCRAQQLKRDEKEAVWISRNEQTGELFAALFNLSEEEAVVSIALENIENPVTSARELWEQSTLEVRDGVISATIPPHGCKVYSCSL